GVRPRRGIRRRQEQAPPQEPGQRLRRVAAGRCGSQHMARRPTDRPRRGAARPSARTRNRLTPRVRRLASHPTPPPFALLVRPVGGCYAPPPRPPKSGENPTNSLLTRPLGCITLETQ